MKLRNKVAFLVLSLWIAACALTYFGSQHIIVSSFLNLEQQQATDNLQRVNETINQMIDKVNTLTTNWAVWDDTYRFVQDKNPNYIKINLSVGSIATGDVDMILYYDTHGNLIYSAALNADRTKIAPLPEFLTSYLKPNSKLLHQTTVNSNTKGLISLPSGVLLIASHAIVTSNNEGPVRGTIIMARYLTRDLIDKLRQITKVNTSLYDMTSLSHQADLLSLFDNLATQGGNILKRPNDQTILGYSLLYDINEQPIALIKASMPRNIYQAGIHTIYYYNIAFIIFSITLTLVLWLCLQKLIVRRLEKLNTDFLQVSPSNKLYQTLMTHIPDEVSSLARLYSQATHDPLTGLANRNLLYQSFSFYSPIIKNQHYIAILFLDIDRFKRINDTLGHEIGDKLLICMAETLRENLGEHDLAVRLGGDEFIVMLVNQTEVQIQQVVQRIFQNLSQPVFIQNHELYLTSSMGVSLYPTHSKDIATLIKQADVAMYQVKSSGRNHYLFYSNELIQAVQEAHQRELELQRAIDNKEFCLHFQPIYDTHTNRIITLEALLRWQHPKRGLLPAGEFISLAEKTGLIVPIGKWVLRAACEQAKQWNNQYKLRIPVSVNISVMQTRNTSISHLIMSTLTETQLDPRLLELELTETGFVEVTSSILTELQELRSMGIQLAVDDFGMGYSGLGYLRRLPVTKLKIDKSFIRDLHSDPDDMAITMAIISIAHQLKLHVIAEGVETSEQYHFLLKNKVDAFQGNYLSPPLSVPDCEKLLLEMTENDKITTD